MALKVLKNRRGGNEVENDLRGLGQTTLFGDMTPEPVLTVHGDWSKLSALAHDLQIEIHPGRDGKEVITGEGAHLHVASTHLSHKEKALQLFAFSLVLKNAHGVSSSLWEHSRLRTELHHAIHEKMQMVHAPTKHETVSLAPSIQLYLHQAGFSVVTSAETLHLSSHDVREHLQMFARKQSLQVARAA